MSATKAAAKVESIFAAAELDTLVFDAITIQWQSYDEMTAALPLEECFRMAETALDEDDETLPGLLNDDGEPKAVHAQLIREFRARLRELAKKGQIQCKGGVEKPTHFRRKIKGPESEQREVAIKDLVSHPALQQREKGLDQRVILDYAESAETLPPVVAFDVDGVLMLADGYHRKEAHLRQGKEVIQAIIYRGATLEDAILYAATANAKHGKQRSVADRRKTVWTLLDNAKWRGRSSNWIASAAGVSWDTVRKVRAQWAKANSSDTLRQSSVAGANGKVYRATTDDLIHRDCLGFPITDDAVRQAFDVRISVDNFLRQATVAQQILNRLCNHPSGAGEMIGDKMQQSTTDGATRFSSPDIGKVCDLVSAGAPYTVEIPAKHAAGLERGYITKGEFDSLPEKDRQAIMAKAAEMRAAEENAAQHRS